MPDGNGAIILGDPKNKVLIESVHIRVLLPGATLMSLQTEYRNQAAACLAAAHATENHGSKALFLMIANAWVKLADQLEARRSNVVPLKLAQSSDRAE